MKKKNVILLAGIISVAMLGGCGEKTSEETNTAITQDAEATTQTQETEEQEIEEQEIEEQETEETVEEEAEEQEIEEQETEETVEEEAEKQAEAAIEEFATVMAEIYGVNGDATKAEVAAENFKNYAFAKGAASSSSVFETLANEWFQTMEEAEGKDIRAEFKGSFETVISTAQSKDETLEYDVAYLNVVNGILATIGETQEATEEVTETQETDVAVNEEFASIMAEIYGVNGDATKAEAVAENFKNYAFANGAPSSSTAFETLANEWFQTMEAAEGKDIRAEFSEAFNTVTTAAQSKDETLETDVAYSNVVNGIFAAIGQ